MKKSILVCMIAFCFFFVGCENPPTSDQIKQSQQEEILQKGTAQIGMPQILTFRELQALKDILELRDKAIVTYTYIYSPYTQKFVFLGETVGYPIPYATQFTSPSKVEWHHQVPMIIPQADPNGLFSPASAEATWILMKDPTPGSMKVAPVYVEDRVQCYPWKLPEAKVSH